MKRITDDFVRPSFRYRPFKINDFIVAIPVLDDVCHNDGGSAAFVIAI